MARTSRAEANQVVSSLIAVFRDHGFEAARPEQVH